jgi:hypothetical protein
LNKEPEAGLIEVSIEAVSAATPHDPIECLEVSARLPILEESDCLKRRNLLGYSGSDELIDAGSSFPAEPLDRFLQRARQPQRMFLSLSSLNPFEGFPGEQQVYAERVYAERGGSAHNPAC